MHKNEIIRKIEIPIKEKMENETTGHDWHHVDRVRKMALFIGEKEGVDIFIVELAALLHDIGDWKFSKDRNPESPDIAKEFLTKIGVDNETISHVVQIISDMDFKGANVPISLKSKEAMVVFDADKLDALGAIGIARCFATSQKLGCMIYNPEIKPKLHDSFEEYKLAKGTAINHFYEKLLLLKDIFHTKSAKEIAVHRHEVMEMFLNEFKKEWEGKDYAQSNNST
ncbi:MAG: HD domain-containing protein [Candidatus Aenigmarchaeota archaeon]|nr:HD domain-containing protein [Candidatus Aenigmarchaeota archaeon]